MKKKGGGGDEGGSWMDTYGDLVTLLLTFFVLLYSMSSLDQAKWDVFVRSIYPNGRPGEKSAEQIVINGEVTNESGSGSVGDSKAPKNEVNTEDPKDLYLQIARALNDAGISGVEVSRGQDILLLSLKIKLSFTETGPCLPRRDSRHWMCAVMRFPVQRRICLRSISWGILRRETRKERTIRETTGCFP